MTRLTSKGQVTIPKEVRDELGLAPGDDVEFVVDRGVVRLRKGGVDFEAAFRKWSGYLRDFEGQSAEEIIEEMRGR